MDEELRQEAALALRRIEDVLRRVGELLDEARESGVLPAANRGIHELELNTLDESLSDLARRLWGKEPPLTVFASPQDVAHDARLANRQDPLAWLIGLQTGLGNAKAFFESQLARTPAGPAAAVPERKHVVLLIHGIRTQGEWEQQAAAALESDPTIRVRPTRYEFFDVIRFLLPGSLFRDRPVQRIERMIRDELTRRPAHLSVIAHSFGTFIVSKILEREADISFHRLILCGSIVPDDFPWENYRHRLGDSTTQDWQVVNDCAMQDIWPVLAKSITWGYGSSGRFGFGHVRVKDRFFNGGHSSFFEDKRVREYWLPYIRSGQVVEGMLQRSTNPWWVSVLAVFKLRYVALAALIFGAYVAYGPLMQAVSARIQSQQSTQAMGVTLHTADPMLNEFLGNLRGAVVAHDWPRVLTFFRERNFDTQASVIGIGAPQYIQEGLGLGYVDNLLIERPGDMTDFKKLNSIVDIDFQHMGEFRHAEGGEIDGPAFDYAIVTGQATLVDGSKRRVEIEVVKKSTGGYHLGVTVG